jgi:hypothetical protein
LGLALPPMMILMLNVAGPESATQWQLFRLEPLKRLQRWVGSWGDPALEPVGLVPESASLDLGSSLWRRFNPGFQFLWSMQRGVTPVHGGLLVWGLGAWWRKWRRAAGGPLVLTAILTTVGIWIHLRATGSASSRYWLTAVLLSLPMAGLGLESLVSAVTRWLAKRTSPRLAVRTALVSCVGLLVITGWIDALSANLDSRRHYAELGRWIQGHFGPQQIFGTDDHLPLVSHYARAHYTPIPRTATGQSLVRLIEGCGPEVVILTRRGAWEDYRQLLDERSRLGLERIDASQLPPGAERFVVLARAVHRH